MKGGYFTLAKSKMIIDESLEAEVLNFYLSPNSAREVERQYGVNLYQLKKLLKKHDIAMHSKEEAFELRGHRIASVCLARYGVTNPFAADSVKEKIKQSMLVNHGVEYVGQAEVSKRKTKATLMQHYGVDSYAKTKEFKQNMATNKEVNSEKAKDTLLNKYGVDNPLKIPEAREKRANTIEARYGQKNFTNRDKAKRTIKQRYGTTSLAAVPEIRAKQYETKRKNGTFNTSKSEERFYVELCKKFGAADVIRQYKDVRYPFFCDFYIKSLDLFIELNLSWTHGDHRFCPDSQEDCLKLHQWQEKASTSKYYENAIITWTVRDTAKFEAADRANLKYLAFYSEAAANSFIKSGGPLL